MIKREWERDRVEEKKEEDREIGNGAGRVRQTKVSSRESREN